MLIGKAGDRTDAQVVDEHGRVIANCGMEPSHQLDDDEAIANARLVASVPELLYALQSLAGQIDLSRLNVRKDFGLLNAHAFALKVIHKITNP